MSLRKLKNKDLQGMLEWMHDGEINKNFYANFSEYDESQVLDFIISSFSEDNRHYACVNEDDEYLGTVSLKNIDYISRNAEYAISFRKCAHGSGAAYFATQEILKIAFEELKLERVYLNVISKNEHANNFYKKCGFIFEGVFRKHININNHLEDLRWYSILKEEHSGL